MKINNQFLPILASTSVFSVAGVLTVGSMSASAASFTPGTLNIGDQLTIVNDVNVSDVGVFEWFEVGSPPGPSEPVGSYGNFGVTNASTGGFADLTTNGDVVSFYDIQSFSIGGATPPGPGSFVPSTEVADNTLPGQQLQFVQVPTEGDTPFLALDPDDDGNDDLTFRFEEITFLSVSPIGGSQEQYTLAGSGTFTDSTGNFIATGSFNGTRLTGPGNNSNSGTFTVTDDIPDVPEPATMISLFAVAGLAASGAVGKKERALKK